MTMPFFDDGKCQREKEIQELLDAPMPWIGMYIATASAVCSIAMAADAFSGFRSRKLWFPCKYFSLNATSLTLLAVAMKLPIDLTTYLGAGTDWLARLSSLIFMSTAMGNFAPSLGSMEDKDILTNVIALGILVITIIVNECTQNFQLGTMDVNFLACTLMLLLLVNIVSSAIIVRVIKNFLESKHQEMPKIDANEEQEAKWGHRFRIDEQREALKRHMMMAETSNSQFVMARSVVSVTSGVICLLAALILAAAYSNLAISMKFKLFEDRESAYGWSTTWILVIQSIGVAIGTITPTLRLFFVVRLKCSNISYRSFKKELKIETYWIQRLVDWRDTSTFSQVRYQTCTKYLHSAKRLVLNFCIGAQTWNILVNKLVVFISALLMNSFFFCFTSIKKLKTEHSRGVCSSKTKNHNESKSDGSRDLVLSPYVLLLEGEAKLPEKTLNDICHQMDRLIQTGKKQQPKNLINLLHKCSNFSGVTQFDTDKVSSLHTQEPPNCWTLPVVTLATIAMALPSIANNKAKQLMSSVSEGLSLAKLTETTLEIDTAFTNIRNAANITWLGVVYYRRWQDIDLHEASLHGKISKQILQDLSNRAEKTIMDFKRDEKDLLMQNPINWPAKVIAANSMYRISKTILLACEGNYHHTDEGLFEQLSVMIADIFAACLTNLPRVIATKCSRNAIEEREKSVREAFLLLGKTEEIFDLLQQLEWPCLDPDKAAYVEEWRALQEFENKIQPGTVSMSSSYVATSEAGGEHVTVVVREGSFQHSEILVQCDQDREEPSSRLDIAESTMGTNGV